MGEFSELRARIHDENRQVVERRVYAVTGQHLPEDDIDRMIETGGLGQPWQALPLDWPPTNQATVTQPAVAHIRCSKHGSGLIEGSAL